MKSLAVSTEESTAVKDLLKKEDPKSQAKPTTIKKKMSCSGRHISKKEKNLAFCNHRGCHKNVMLTIVVEPNGTKSNLDNILDRWVG